jgi:hypothetical protein
MIGRRSQLWTVGAAAALALGAALVYVASPGLNAGAMAERASQDAKALAVRVTRVEEVLARLERRLGSGTSTPTAGIEDTNAAGGNAALDLLERRLAVLENRAAGSRPPSPRTGEGAASTGGDDIDLSALSADELAVYASRNRGLASEKAGEQVGALVRAYTEMLERFPDDRRRENTLYNLVDTLLRAQRFDEAREAALTWGPKIGLPEWRVCKYLSDNAMGQRDLARAREHSEKIARGGSEVPSEAKAGAQFTIAHSWYLEGDSVKAQHLFSRLLDEFGSSEDPKLTAVVQGARRQLAILKDDTNR